MDSIVQDQTNVTFVDNKTEAPDIAIHQVTVYAAPLWNSDFSLAVIYCIIVGVALCLGTFGNIIILLVTMSTNVMNKIGKYFVINLALADLCVAAIADPMCIVGVVKGEAWFNDKWILCEIVAAMCLTACFCAFLSLTNVTVNRYVYVCHYNVYNKVYTKTSTFILCFSCWILAFLFEFPNFVGWGDHYFDQKSHQCIWDRTAHLSYTIFVAAGLIGSPLCLMGLCFILIFRKIWKTKLNVFSIDKDDPHRGQKALKETLQASRTLVVIFFVFVVCWTPYAIITAIDVKDTFSVETHLFVTLLAHLHSSLNFVIYTASNKNFRKSVSNLFRSSDSQKYGPTVDSSASGGRVHLRKDATHTTSRDSGVPSTDYNGSTISTLTHSNGSAMSASIGSNGSTLSIGSDSTGSTAKESNGSTKSALTNSNGAY